MTRLALALAILCARALPAWGQQACDERNKVIDHLGENVHSRADDCEAQAVEFCWRKLGHKPDKVTRL